MNRMAFSRKNATPIDAMASANGRRSRIGRNTTRSTSHAMTPVTTRAAAHAHAIRQPHPWFTANAANAPIVRYVLTAKLGKRSSFQRSENATAGRARMPPATRPFHTYCVIGGIRQGARSEIDDGHLLDLALPNLVDAEGTGEDVALGVEVARPGGALVVDLLALLQEASPFLVGGNRRARRIRDRPEIVLHDGPGDFAAPR